MFLKGIFHKSKSQILGFFFFVKEEIYCRKITSLDYLINFFVSLSSNSYLNLQTFDSIYSFTVLLKTKKIIKWMYCFMKMSTFRLTQNVWLRAKLKNINCYSLRLYTKHENTSAYSMKQECHLTV